MAGSSKDGAKRLQRPAHALDSLDESAGFTPIEMVAQGIEQKVSIPLSFMLVRVMETLGCREAPVFKCHSLGDFFQASVHVELTGARFYVGGRVKYVELDGEVSHSPLLAEESAARKIFEYLDHKHGIRIVDHSSRMIESIGFRHATRSADHAKYEAEKLLHKWDMSIQLCVKLRNKLHRQVINGVTTGAGKIYGDLINFLENSITTKFLGKNQNLSSKFKACEELCLSQMNELLQNYEEEIRKGHSQELHFSEKHTLDYILSHLGLENGEYSNAVVEGGFKGEVQFDFQCMEEMGYGGKLKFCGKLSATSTMAEEEAASKALEFLRKKLKVDIVDLNYTDLLHEMEVEQSMVDLLEKFLQIVEEVKTQWGLMLDFLHVCLDVYSSDEGENTLAEEETKALSSCCKEIGDLIAEVVKNHSAAIARNKRTEGLSGHLMELKQMLSSP